MNELTEPELSILRQLVIDARHHIHQRRSEIEYQMKSHPDMAESLSTTREILTTSLTELQAIYAKIAPGT